MEIKDNVKALEKGLIVLETIKESDQPLGVNEISRQCNMNLTTAFRILQTLKRRNWVYQDQNDKYIAGSMISFVTEKTNLYISLKEVAYYTMTRLTGTESQAMNLVVRENERCVILQQSRTNKIIDYVPPKGSILPVNASACGKILLSELPEVILEGILDNTDMKPLTNRTITKRAVFLEELTNVRKLGYAMDVHESQEEGICIAVPVRSPKGEIIAALSFSGFIGQALPNGVPYYFALLQKASAEISSRLFDILDGE